MAKKNWKALICFVVLMTSLSVNVVQYGVDAQFRGYPLPFLAIESGIAGKTVFAWRIPNLLMSLFLYYVAATAALATSRLRVAAKNWLFVGLGVALFVAIASYFLWRGVESPITHAEALDHALSVSRIVRHLLAGGMLISAVFIFAFFLSKSNTTSDGGE